MASIVKRFARNEIGHDYVVGDIHGCFTALGVELNRIGFDGHKDRLFSVGDLVDRGPESEASIDWISIPWFHAVRGNHEQMAIGVAAGRHDMGNYLVNGGGWFLSMPDSHQKMYAEVFDDLPIAIEIDTPSGRVGIIHADLGEYTDWDEFTQAIEMADSNNKRKNIREIALWSRSRISYDVTTPIAGVTAVYVGHTPVKESKWLGNVHYIDTGAVFGGKFTIVKLA